MPLSQEERQAAFRREHRPGQRLRGRVLSLESYGLAWVSFSGLPLLARLKSTPEPGDVLGFIVESLSPDIVLREIEPQAANVPGLLALLQAFLAARQAFDEAARQHKRTVGTLSAMQRRDFLAMLQSAEAIETLERTEAALALINAALPKESGRRLLWEPWNAPGVEELDQVLFEDKDGRGISEWNFRHPGTGECRIPMSRKPGGTAFRIQAERPENAEAQIRALGIVPQDAYCLGCERLRPEPPLRRLLQRLVPDAHWGGFSARA